MDGSHNTIPYNTFMEKTLPHGPEYINQCWMVLDFFEPVSHRKRIKSWVSGFGSGFHQ
jgi:hypothetical protein